MRDPVVKLFYLLLLIAAVFFGAATCRLVGQQVSSAFNGTWRRDALDGPGVSKTVKLIPGVNYVVGKNNTWYPRHRAYEVRFHRGAASWLIPMMPYASGRRAVFQCPWGDPWSPYEQWVSVVFRDRLSDITTARRL